jgi:hypothetical protein
MNRSYENLVSLFLYDQTSMTSDQLEALSAWILEHPVNARVFLDEAMLHRNIHDYFIRSDHSAGLPFSALADEASEDIQALNPEVWQLLSEHEKSAPSVEPPPKPKEKAAPRRASVERPPQPINKFSLVSAVVSLAAVLFIVATVHLAPVTVYEEAAVLSDLINVQWNTAGGSLQKGDRICTNTRPIIINKGLLKLLLDNRTSVLVEGPAEFVLVAPDQIKLNNGRLYASVPPEAIGFTVTTPNSKVIDLGTEFGVQVDYGETTQVHVTKGKTTVVAGSKGLKRTLQVGEGAARRISSRSAEIEEVQYDRDLFVRDIRSEYNMIWRGQALELSELLQGGPPDARRAGKSPGRNEVLESIALAPGEFCPIETNPYVEGVFTPNGINGPVPVTADGAFSWEAPAMEVRQKIGYLRFDIGGVRGDRTDAVLTLHPARRIDQGGEIQVYGLRDGEADFWDEAQITYNTAAGFRPAPLGRYQLDGEVLERLGTMTLSGETKQQSKPSSLRLDDFIARDTNGLLTLILISEHDEGGEGWLIRSKEAGVETAPRLTFPRVNDGGREVSTADGRGADTYLSNDNQYDSTGPDDNHGAEPVFKLRNYFKSKAVVAQAGLAGLQEELFGGVRRLALHGAACGSGENPGICLRTNSGITFDLQKLRHCFDAALCLKSFTAVCGPADVSDSYYSQQRRWSRPPQAGFHVLVDGQERFARADMQPGDAPGPIDIELKPEDRYLTLVVTSGSDRKAPRDWGVFACPRIEVE